LTNAEGLDSQEMNIRRFVLRANSLDELVRLGTPTTQCARFLEASVVAGLNLVVAGGPLPLRCKRNRRTKGLMVWMPSGRGGSQRILTGLSYHAILSRGSCHI